MALRSTTATISARLFCTKPRGLVIRTACSCS
ncbi:hypothetical protein CKAH01_08853 [Colletotrichum kahawae]|uniref:Uncharacterized protein n=1 Tax=Colletotrichum kahawae TaxID=34407 RepID=A0AAD9Y1U1_COLKA|nr:hypothetical protein CKAH01_08853 [Colletotrichum kahawae]